MLKDTLSIASQVLMLFLLIGVGFVLARIGCITSRGAKQMTNLLLFVVTPCVIINAFGSSFDASKASGLLIAAAIAVLWHIIGIFVSKPFFRKESDRTGIYRYASIYSNCGFMSLPLIQAVLGSEGILYGVTGVAIFQVCTWTHGVALVSGDKKTMSFKNALINPGTAGIVLSFLLFIIPVKLPSPLMSSIDSLASLNTPLAMIIIGVFMARMDFLSILKNKYIYLAALLRLLVVPGLLMAALYFLPIPAIIFKTMVIPAAAPPATNTVLFAARFNKDTEIAGQLTSFITLASILTMPIVIAAAGFLAKG